MKIAKKITALFLTFLLTIAVFSGCELPSDDDGEIKDIVSKLEKSINEENLEDFIQCFYPETIQPILSVIDSAETYGYSKADISADIFQRFSQDTASVNFQVKNIKYNDAKDEATADVTLNASDIEPVTSELGFIKSGENWLIDGTNIV